MDINKDTLDSVFSYHAPTISQVAEYEEIRKVAKTYADLVLSICPASRERSLALTKIQESVMWANASKAINEPRE